MTRFKVRTEITCNKVGFRVFCDGPILYFTHETTAERSGEKVEQLTLERDEAQAYEMQIGNILRGAEKERDALKRTCLSAAELLQEARDMASWSALPIEMKNKLDNILTIILEKTTP